MNEKNLSIENPVIKQRMLSFMLFSFCFNTNDFDNYFLLKNNFNINDDKKIKECFDIFKDHLTDQEIEDIFMLNENFSNLDISDNAILFSILRKYAFMFICINPKFILFFKAGLKDIIKETSEEIDISKLYYVLKVRFSDEQIKEILMLG